NRRQSLAQIIPGQPLLEILHQAGRRTVAVYRARERLPESGQVRAAILVFDVVGEAKNVFLKRIVPLNGGLDLDAVDLALDANGWLVNGLLVAVEVAHERGDAAHIRKLMALLAALVGDGDGQPAIQVR